MLGTCYSSGRLPDEAPGSVLGIVANSGIHQIDGKPLSVNLTSNNKQMFKKGGINNYGLYILIIFIQHGTGVSSQGY